MALEPSVLIKKSDGTFERVLLSELAKRPKKVAPVLVVKKSDEIVIEKVEAPVVASESVVKKEINIDLPKTPIVNKEPVKNIVLPTALPKAKIVLPKVFYKGLNDWRGMKLFTSVGLGESGGPIRFWNPPEIAIINLKPQN